METQCNESQMHFQGHGRRKVEADFDGGRVSSDGGVLLIREVDAQLNIIDEFAQCFTGYRDPELIEHTLEELIRHRVYRALRRGMKTSTTTAICCAMPCWPWRSARKMWKEKNAGANPTVRRYKTGHNRGALFRPEGPYPDSLGQRSGNMGARNYTRNFPKSGLRFSLKALRPSCPSSVW